MYSFHLIFRTLYDKAKETFVYLIKLLGHCGSATKQKASQNPGADDLRAMQQEHNPLENINFWGNSANNLLTRHAFCAIIILLRMSVWIWIVFGFRSELLRARACWFELNVHALQWQSFLCAGGLVMLQKWNRRFELASFFYLQTGGIQHELIAQAHTGGGWTAG